MFEGSESSELKRDEFIADSSNPRDVIAKGRVVDHEKIWFIRIKWDKGLLAFSLSAGTKDWSSKNRTSRLAQNISRGLCFFQRLDDRWESN